MLLLLVDSIGEFLFSFSVGSHRWKWWGHSKFMAHNFCRPFSCSNGYLLATVLTSSDVIPFVPVLLEDE